MRGLARLSLHGRLLLVALLPAVLIAALVTALVLYRVTQVLDGALRERGSAIASFLAPAAEYGVISGNRASLEVLLRAVMAERDVSAVAIYNDEGALLSSHGRLTVLQPDALRPITLPTTLEGSGPSLSALAPVLPEAIHIEDLVPFYGEENRQAVLRPVGWVHVELDRRPAVREKQAIVGATIALVLGIVALTSILAMRLARSVSGPVARLVNGVRKMAAGDLDVQIPEQAASSELIELEQGFNTMARSISDVHRTMQSRIDATTAQLAHQAHHDPLTGLPNRRVFEQRLEECVHASRRTGDHGALCFIDLDRFKIVNDTCGHTAGDELLCQIATLVRQRVREEDVVCRVGGDEFALILRGCTPADALRIAENLREAVAAFRFSWEERRFSVGASIGLVHIDGSQESASEVLMAADVACYGAKKHGRNQVVEHAARPVPVARQRNLFLLPGPREADAASRLELHAQGIVSLAGRPPARWAEILLRVRDDHGELHLPGDYLARLEQVPEALEVDLWVAARACAALAGMEEDEARAAALSLNLSRGSILQATVFLDRVGRLLHEHGLAPRRLVFELATEMMDRHPEECRELVARLHAMGCLLALQQLDGGGIRHLGVLQPDYVKVSMGKLIASYGLEAACDLAEALAGMASAMEIPSVASEVEDPVLLDTLHAYGFHLAQGHAVSSPVPLDRWCSPAAAVTKSAQGAP